MKKYIIIAILALLIGNLVLAPNQKSKINISDESIAKLEELNKQYGAIKIRTLISQNQDDEIHKLENELLTSITNLSSNKNQETDKKLLFKIKNTPENPESIFEIHLNQNATDLEKIANEYESAIREFEYVEPDYKVEIADFNFDSKTINIASEETKTNDEEATHKVTVAVIDTGVDIEHKDLNKNIWTNQNEINLNRIDDDINQYTDDKFGWNFIRENKDSYTDLNGHGTHIAGIINRDNKADLMALKVIDNREGNISSVVKAIKYASDNGAEVMNLSIGTTEKSESLEKAVQYAQKKGIIIVAAAGNNGDQTKYYPAAFDGVIAVGATDEENNRLSRSNYGNWVDTYAPGKQILSTLPNDVYGKKSGTSQAAATFTNQIVELKSKYPTRNNEIIKQHALYLFRYR